MRIMTNAATEAGAQTSMVALQASRHDLTVAPTRATTTVLVMLRTGLSLSKIWLHAVLGPAVADCKKCHHPPRSRPMAV